MAQPTYVLDAVFASDALLRTLTEQYGTPLLVYDRETWLARVESLRHAFAWAPRFRQFFRSKRRQIRRCSGCFWRPVAACCAAARRS